MNPVLKHLLIRLAIIFLVPGLFLFCLGLMLQGEENVDIGLGLIGLMGTYFVAAILFIFFETVHLFKTQACAELLQRRHPPLSYHFYILISGLCLTRTQQNPLSPEQLWPFTYSCLIATFLNQQLSHIFKIENSLR